MVEGFLVMVAFQLLGYGLILNKSYSEKSPDLGKQALTGLYVIVCISSIYAAIVFDQPMLIVLIGFATIVLLAYLAAQNVEKVARDDPEKLTSAVIGACLSIAFFALIFLVLYLALD
jgi:hypothetical protein